MIDATLLRALEAPDLVTLPREPSWAEVTPGLGAPPPPAADDGDERPDRGGSWWAIASVVLLAAIAAYCAWILLRRIAGR